MLLRKLLFAAIVFFGAGTVAATENESVSEPAKAQVSPWHFEAGVSAGRPTPIQLNAGVGYKQLFVRAFGSGIHINPDEYWVGFRGSFAWEFFNDLPFSLDLGIGSGYSFAKAPNAINKALNRNNPMFRIRTYNYKEALDISAEVRANIYGVFTYVAIPVHCFMKHDEPTILWQIGYAYRF